MGERLSVLCMILAGIICWQAGAAFAQEIPNTAEAGRLPQKPPLLPSMPEISPSIVVEPVSIGIKPPANAKDIKVQFQNIDISGATILPADKTTSIKRPYLGKEIPLSSLWELADTITHYYRDRGFFLSRAYVPAQEIDGGTARIEVIEGYIAEVKLPDTYAKDRYLRSFSKHLTQQHPISAHKLERELLLLNDASNEQFQARLEALEQGQADKPRNGIRLVLETQPKPKISGGLNVNNYGSRYMGPYQANGTLNIRSGNRQQSTLFGGISQQHEEMKHVYARHAVNFAAGWEASAYAAYSNAVPGYSLKSSDIESDSRTAGVELHYSAIRQRFSNLDLRMNLEGRNVDSDTQNSILTRDRVRALRLGGYYENQDRWHGSNAVNIACSQGLDLFGSSEEGERDLSRASATPDFRKFELFLRRTQRLGDLWIATATASGQYSFDPLYSSEEFGYGGMGFGRAYDNSELLGDSGIAAALEMGYNGLPDIGDVEFQPFVFVDGGKLWNRDAGQEAEVTAYSTGFGVHALYNNSIRADATLAFPLDHPAEAPQFGNDKNPRLLVQLQYLF